VTRKERIEERLAALEPVGLSVEDESHRHKGGRESHYNVTVVTAAFEGLGRIERHRKVHALLGDELAGGLHALTLTLRTPGEHTALGGAAIVSPSCAGGTGR
jgi:BolA protein